MKRLPLVTICSPGFNRWRCRIRIRSCRNPDAADIDDLSACIGLVPAAISTGIDSQVQQPLACVIVGGMLLSPVCSLLVIPVLARLWMPTVGKSGLDAPGPQSSAATSA